MRWGEISLFTEQYLKVTLKSFMGHSVIFKQNYLVLNINSRCGSVQSLKAVVDEISCGSLQIERPRKCRNVIL